MTPVFWNKYIPVTHCHTVCFSSDFETSQKKKLGNIWESEIRSVAEIVLLAIGIVFTSLFTL